MTTRAPRLLAIPIMVAIVATAAAPSSAHAGAISGASGVRIEPTPAATLDGAAIERVRGDAAGRIFVSSGAQIASFDAAGRPLARWTLPGGASRVVFDVSPQGEVFAAAYGGDVIYRYRADGSAVGSFTGEGTPARLDRIFTIAYDPRGTVWVTDYQYGDRIKLFTPEGAFTGTAVGSMQPLALSASGVRWQVFESAVRGYTARGRLYQQLGDSCALGGGSRERCPGGIGTFGASQPSDISTDEKGNLASLSNGAAGTDRVQLFDRGGRIQVACDHLLQEPVASLDLGDGGRLLLSAANRVYRAQTTKQSSSHCVRARLRLRRIRVHAGRTVTFSLTRPARVELRLIRTVGSSAVEAQTRSIPRGRRRVEITRCRRGRCLNRGRWYVSLRATGRSGDRFDSPALKWVRF